MKSHIFTSYAKINLGLKIIEKRYDGFHNIDSIFIQIDLCDKLIFTPSENFFFKCNNKMIETDRKNTICRVYNHMNANYDLKQKYKITLDKLIPISGGLGGGSSNAACALLALNKLGDLNLNSKVLNEIALSVGSDVPYFLKGGIKQVTGRGEIMKNIDVKRSFKNLTCLIVAPKFKISTKWAYNNIKKYLDSNIKRPKFSPLDEGMNWQLFENDFEEVVKSTYPEIMIIKQTMYDNGALFSSLSGSGSTMFGIYNNTKFINNTLDKLQHYKTYIASLV